MLEATFTATPVSVTPDLSMVELILSGTGTVQGFGPATDVTGVVEDHAVSPCGAGGASDSAQKRIVMHGGILVLHEAGMLCLTASGPQVTATYRVDGGGEHRDLRRCTRDRRCHGQRRNRPRNAFREADPRTGRRLTGGRVPTEDTAAREYLRWECRTPSKEQV